MPLARTDPPILAATCRCGWEYPRDLFLARRRSRAAAPGLSSEDLGAVLAQEPLCVYFICPSCSAEIFADIGVMPSTPRVITG